MFLFSHIVVHYLCQPVFLSADVQIKKHLLKHAVKAMPGHVAAETDPLDKLTVVEQRQ